VHFIKYNKIKTKQKTKKKKTITNNNQLILEGLIRGNAAVNRV